MSKDEIKIKPNLLLDLDATLIHALTPDEITKKDKRKLSKFRIDNMEEFYKVLSRPYLQEFLDYAFKNFNVSVWTAASKDYALFIIENIVLNNQPERNLDFFFFSYHCGWSKKKKKGTKNLAMLWDVHKLDGYNPKNTIILDDFVEDVHKTQPENCIIAAPFDFFKDDSHKDTFLKDVIPYMDEMIERISQSGECKTSTINIPMKTV